jgi:hypothetical protein
MKMKWIDCLWGVFTDAVIPVLVAVFSVYVAEGFARKRDYKQKVVELKIDYLKQEVQYLAQIENDIFKVTREAINLGDKSNKPAMYNTVVDKLSNINEQNIATVYLMQSFNETMNIGIDLDKYKKDIGDCINNLKKICKDKVCKDNASQFEKDINDEVNIAVATIQETTNLIMKSMTLTIENLEEGKQKGRFLKWITRRFQGR